VACGVLGGSFDPVHRGHLAAAEAALRLRGLAAVLLVPAGEAPHKRAEPAPFEHRLAMARLAIEGHEGLKVLDLEGRRPGPSYTVDTLAELHRLYRGERFELLVGADMLRDLPTWRRAAEVVSAATIVAFGRPGSASEAARKAFDAAFGEGRHVWIEFTPLDASSSEVRRRLKAKEPVQELLDPRVERYIRRFGLYGTGGAAGGGSPPPGPPLSFPP
jgi:nicotinate-nucleotide adenylyltransferase